MKIQLFYIIAFTIYLILQSCSQEVPDSNQDKKVEPEISLSGKVYLLSDSVSSNCSLILPGTDFWPTFLFLNDSLFIKTIDNCCMPSTISHYSGKYQLTDDMLLLSYDSLQVVYTYAMEPDSAAGIPAGSPDIVEVEKSDLQTEKLVRFNCGDKPYFKQTSGSWEGRFIALASDTIENCIKEIKARRSWDGLVISKK